MVKICWEMSSCVLTEIGPILVGVEGRVLTGCGYVMQKRKVRRSGGERIILEEHRFILELEFVCI